MENASQHLVQHSWKLRILWPARSERFASHTHLSLLMSRSSFCREGGHFRGRTRFWLRRHLVVAREGDLSMRCWWWGGAECDRYNYNGTTEPQDCCTIVLLRHVQFIANKKINHALLSKDFLFSFLLAELRNVTEIHIYPCKNFVQVLGKLFGRTFYKIKSLFAHFDRIVNIYLLKASF